MGSHRGRKPLRHKRDHISRGSTRKKTMKDQPRTERKDRLEQLRKMESNLKDEEPSTKPAMTVCEQQAADLQAITCNLAYLKLTAFELEGNMKEDEACLSTVKAEKRRAEVARMWQTYARLEETVRLSQARFERAVQQELRAMKSHKSQSTSQKDANLDAFIAEMSSRLDGIVAYLTPKEEETSSETPRKEAEMENDTPKEEAKAEINPSQEETEVEDDTLLEEAETEDDIRLKGIFAEQERVTAQIKSLGTYVEFKAQNEMFMKKHDEGKAQRLRDARLRDGLEDVQETS